MISRVYRRLFIAFRVFTTKLKTGLWFSSLGVHNKIYGKGLLVGRNVSIGNFCWIEAVNKYKTHKGVQCFNPEIIVGDDVAMSDFVHISAVKRIKIGAGTLIGSKVYIGDHSHGSYKSEKWRDMSDISPRYRPLDDIAEINIGKNCWIGDGAVILAGTHIGDNCVIGANSVVKGSFQNNQLIVGSPAKVIKEII